MRSIERKKERKKERRETSQRIKEGNKMKVNT